jgi:hypothetical protein
MSYMQKQARKQFLIAIAVVAAIAAPAAYLAYLQVLSALWPSLVLILFLLGFPALARYGAPTMLLGLFDLELSPRKRIPVRVFLVTLAAYCVAATAYTAGRLMLLAGPASIVLPPPCYPAWIWAFLHPALCLGAGIAVIVTLDILAAVIPGYAIAFSHGEDPSRPVGRMILGAGAALLAADGISLAIVFLTRPTIFWLKNIGFGGTRFIYHLEALLVGVLILLLYTALWFYGRRHLGKGTMVAALIGVLMVVMVFGWTMPALIFLLGKWHIPVLLVIVVVAVLVKYFHGADHTYEMKDRDPFPLPSPGEVLTAGGRQCAIVVAAAGGGIQAAAWTAQVLKGLRHENGEKFDKALCALSGISGGSMGSACYVHWLAHPDVARDPVEAASDSSLDEVAWGLAWPDLIRFFLPPAAANLIDRAGAMEIAWAGNSSQSRAPKDSPLWNALSTWNQRVTQGELPALFMGATIVESGGPLIMGTSKVAGPGAKKGHQRASSEWMDGDRLHVEFDRETHKLKPMDIPIVRAARLSATFPYVTSAARPRLAVEQPHMMDGGFFDNYGAATLIEWLDQGLEALEAAGKLKDSVKKILLIQTQGFPKEATKLPNKENSHQGWPYQLIAPLTALASVRTTGQDSHRSIELELLKQKWASHGVMIEEAPFICNYKDAPLSWHLTPKQIAAIGAAWEGKFDTEKYSVREQAKRVGAFLH